MAAAKILALSGKWRALLIAGLLAFVCLALLRACSLIRSSTYSRMSFDGRTYSVRDVFASAEVAALADAAAKNDIKEIDRLLAAGAQVNFVGQFGFTPMMWAVRAQALDGFQRLLERGARLDLPNKVTLSAMGLAAGPAPNAKFLVVALEHGGHPNFVEESEFYRGMTPIFLAIQSGDVERVELLIKAGADVNARAREHITPLLHAGSCREFRCAFVLLSHGADYRLGLPNGVDFKKSLDILADPPWWTSQYWWKRRVRKFIRESEKKPNQSPEPMVMSVTPRAGARVAPSTTVAHL